MTSRLLSGAAACGVALSLSASAWADTPTITVTDVNDRTVEVPARAERILLGFYFEDFMAIAGPKAFDRVVAISKDAWFGWRNLQWQAYSKVLPQIEDLADVGEVDAGTFSVEAALATRPDVAILADWQYSALGDAVGQMEAAGIPVVVADYNAQTVERHVASTLLIGQIVGEEARAQELADAYAAAVADVQSRVAKAGATGEAPSVYVELGNKGPQETGNTYSGHMWGGVVSLAGGRNIAEGQVAKWAPLSPEFTLAQRPEHIFVAGSGWIGRDRAVLMGPTIPAETTHERLRPYLDRPGWSELPAVLNGEVHALYHGGARTLYDFAFLQYVAKQLYPEAFADVDPQANLEGFFDAYLPIDAAGTYMTKLPN